MSIKKRGWISVLVISMMVLSMSVGPRTADTVRALPPVPLLDASGVNPLYADYPAASRMASSSDAAFRWDIETVDSTNDVGSHTSAALDPRDGIVFISYYDATTTDLRLTSPVTPTSGNCGPGNSWWCRTVDTTADDVGRASSIDIWQDENVWKLGISYYNATTYSLEYAQYTEEGTSQEWTFTTIAGGSTFFRYGGYTSLAFDSTGTPHIAYYSTSAMFGSGLMYAHYVGGGAGSYCTDADWTCDGIDHPSEAGAGAGSFASLALNESDQPRIAYWHSGTFSTATLRFAQYLGSGGNCGPADAWQCDEIDGVADSLSVVGGGPLVSLQVKQRPSGETAHIAYYDAADGTLKYATSDASGSGNCGPGNDWTCSEIDDLGSSLDPMGVSLAVDSVGPVIAYHDVDDENVLKVAQPAFRLGLPSGNCGPVQGHYPSWQCSAADDRGGDEDVGSYPAVVLEADQLATVAYHNATTGDLLVARETRQVLPPTSTACGGVFYAAADASLYSDDPDQNFGGGLELQVIGTGTYTRTTLMAFDPVDLGGSIPSGAVIHSAELQLALRQDPTPIPYPFEVHGVAEPWDEGTVTWNTRPALGTGFGARYYSEEYTAGMTSTVRVDVTTWLTLWATRAISQSSLALLPAGGSAVDVRFHSGEAEVEEFLPRLVVRCSPPIVPMPFDTIPADQLQLAGLTRLRANSTVSPTIRLDGGAVRSAMFSVPIPPGVADDGLARAQWFLEEYKDLLRLEDPASELQLVRRSPNGRSIFFRQRHRGVPVFPAEVGVHVDNYGTGTRVTGVSGGYVPHITLDPTPRLSAEEAEALALALVGAVPWCAHCKSLEAQVIGDTQLRYVNLGLMGARDHTTYLAWKVNVAGGASDSLYIDANSGGLLYEESHTVEGFRLDLNNGKHNGPYDGSCGYWGGTDHDFLCNASGCMPGCVGECATAWWNIRNVYAWWFYNLGMDSYDNGGDEIVMYIHVGNNWRNAHWVGGCEFFEFGDGFAIPIDVVGHEYTHAFISHSGHLGSSWMAGVVNESYADIYGYMVDQGDWTIGEDLPPGAQRRDMSDPHIYGDPDHMSEYEYCSQENDQGCVHTNCGIHNKAAYLLITGDGIQGDALGAGRAALMYWHAAHALPGKATQMIHARDAAVAAAQWLVPQYDHWTDGHVCAVRNAYAAVGLGSGDQDCDGVEDVQDPDDDNDGVPDNIDTCPTVPNPSNSDNDFDGEGDACDDNDDKDYWDDDVDNCPLVFQWDQADQDGDGKGDVCDDDDDQDGLPDSIDRCPEVSDSNNLDSDGDGAGDPCDPDGDNDGVCDGGEAHPPGTPGTLPGGCSAGPDNCPETVNPDQANQDGDVFGDECDKCPTVYDNLDNGDVDGDGLGHPCDPDDDNDGICDVGGPLPPGTPGTPSTPMNPTGGCRPGPSGSDNCRLNPNPLQEDSDGDGQGDRCEELPYVEMDVSWVQEFVESEPAAVLLPDTCPQCGSGYLPNGFETRVNVMAGADFHAQVVDSYGTVVARATVMASDPTSIDFHPAPYAHNAYVTGRRDGAAAAGEMPHDAISYWLELYPAEGTDLSQPYTITLTFEGGVPSVYLPLVQRDY